ncbi:hypothetical protein [Marinobacter sp. ELB17]|uniref:hypothetical protein n=1 Tax=Marinobacter sp. ELB17 TaxID=270374 RepID=UPI0000F3B372|nr:hypothetical protein [Marinobacter sp. ELB17]EAZ98346.1 hypothetical protein MELB17_08973 [Marinobacter sp. ELB17]
MTKFVIALATTLLLTACGGSNKEPFLGTWSEVKEDGGKSQTLLITEDSSDKVNILHDRNITKTNGTYLVNEGNLVDVRSNQTKFKLDGETLVLVGVYEKRFTKK